MTEDFPNRAWRFHNLTTQRTAAERPNSFFTIVNPKNGNEYHDANRIIFPGDDDFLKISKSVLRYWNNAGFIFAIIFSFQKK